MIRPPPGLDYIPPECYKALDVFTDEELAALYAWYDKETGLFRCIGFLLHDRITRWANPDKSAALEVLEDQARKEYSFRH